MTTLLIISMTTMILMKHPLSLILSLIITTLIISYATFLISKTSLFSYMIILALLGGMIILFIYMASLSPNMNFQTTAFNKSLLCSLSLVVLYHTTTQNKLIMPPTHPIHLMKMFYNPLIMLIISTYLFISLIVIVKMTSISQGPLRSS